MLIGFLLVSPPEDGSLLNGRETRNREIPKPTENRRTVLSDDHDSDQTASRLLLDIKALNALYPADTELRRVLERSLVDYTDDDVKRLTDAIHPARRVSRSGSVLIAAGEILLASFLAILGIGAFAPSIMGFDSPQQLSSFFSSELASSFGSGPLSTSAPIVVLALSVLLIIGALYLLRRAATELKEAGLMETSGK